MPAWHPSDDDLVLFTFGELHRDETDRIAAHLEACVLCQDIRREVESALKVAAADPVPDPPDGFERVMWARVSAALPSPPAGGWSWRWALGGALASLAVIGPLGLWGFRAMLQTGPGPAPAAASRAADPRERVLLTAVDDHFEQASLLLVELLNAPDEAAASPVLAFVRGAAGDLVMSGRLYRATAEQTGHRAILDMLEDLEAVLVEVARAPENVSPVDRASLRRRIDDDALLFKMRAVTQDIRERQHEITVTPNEG